jgi:hypothetical protein
MRRYSAEDEAYSDKEQQAQEDMVVEHAVEAAARGENVEQLLELMLVSVSANQRNTVKSKFIAALKKRGLKVPSQDADVPSRKTLDRLRNALAITAQEAYNRVVALMAARPDVAARIKEAGAALARNGVTGEKIQIRESELGSISHNAPGVSQTFRDKEQGRGS